MKLRFFCLCVVIAGVLLSVSVVLGPKRKLDPPHMDRPEATYRGGLLTPPLSKPRFTLTDTSGAPFDFWQQTQGYVTLLFFGYTRCPDECPLHVENIKMGLETIPAALREQVRLVFVTTDPTRDSPKLLRAWLDHFDKRFIGLVGSETAVEAAQRATGVPVAKKAVRPGGDYAVSHSNIVLAYTKDNLAHVIYPGGVNQQDWAHDLPFLVKEAWTDR